MSYLDWRSGHHLDKDRTSLLGGDFLSAFSQTDTQVSGLPQPERSLLGERRAAWPLCVLEKGLPQLLVLVNSEARCDLLEGRQNVNLLLDIRIHRRHLSSALCRKREPTSSSFPVSRMAQAPV